MVGNLRTPSVLDLPQMLRSGQRAAGRKQSLNAPYQGEPQGPLTAFYDRL